MIEIHNIDCMEYMKSMSDESVDLIITDPPYDIKNTTSGGNSDLSRSIQSQHDQLVRDNITSSIDYAKICAEMTRVCKRINIYIWCNKAQIPHYLQEFYTDRGCSFDIIKWVKTNPVPAYCNKYMTDTEYCLYFRKGGYCMPQNSIDASTLYSAPINQLDKRKYKHPTIKPIDILRRLIRNSSKVGDLVFDPFAGSGSAGVASVIEGRDFIGCELLQEYADIARYRVSEIIGGNKVNSHTGQVALF
jgi:site-specific DNA-methyltransferase (adenine-specific)